MDLTPEKAAVMGTAFAIAGFLARWVWDRVWHKKDEAVKSDEKQTAETARLLVDHSNRLVIMESAVGLMKAQDAERLQSLGRTQSEVHRLDGKVDGLQTFWRTEFTKLAERFESFEEKVEKRLDNFRSELRSDQQSHEERITATVTEHQKRVHDRLNILASEQAAGFNRLFDELIERITEPRPSPAVPPATPLMPR